jgi:hypothetical protein
MPSDSNRWTNRNFPPQQLLCTYLRGLHKGCRKKVLNRCTELGQQGTAAESASTSPSVTKRSIRDLSKREEVRQKFDSFVSDVLQIPTCIDSTSTLSDFQSCMGNIVSKALSKFEQSSTHLTKEPSCADLSHHLDNCAAQLSQNADATSSPKHDLSGNPQHAFESCVRNSAQTFTNGLGSTLTKRTSHVWETLKVLEGRDLLDELKKRDSADSFLRGVRICYFEQSINSTSRSFNSCIQDVTDEFSHDLISIESAKFHWMIELPDIFEDDSLIPWKSRREDAYKHLRHNFENCRGQLQQVRNSTMVKHGLSHKTTNTFEICVKDAVQIFQNLVDIVDDIFGPDYFPHDNVNVQVRNGTVAAGNNATSAIQERDNEAAPKTETETLPGAAFKQTAFHAKELYSMASIAHSYWLNTCYDLVPYSSTYTSNSDSEEFRTCKAEQDQKHEALKREITTFLESRIIYDVNHGTKFWDAVTQLKKINYSCGGNRDCFSGAVEEFMRAVRALSELVETWRGLIPTI